MVRDTRDSYGLVSRLLHWTMAAAIFGLFGLGLWMSDLDYYSPYYHSAPDLHKSIGMVVLTALVVRLVWRMTSTRPNDEDLSSLERKAARVIHIGFYPLLLLLIASGYLIATADGRPVEVFGVFSVPSIIQDKSLEDPAGLAHTVLAWTMIVIAVLHAGVAIKHHVIDHKPTLRRMWRGA